MIASSEKTISINVLKDCSKGIWGDSEPYEFEVIEGQTIEEFEIANDYRLDGTSL